MNVIRWVKQQALPLILLMGVVGCGGQVDGSSVYAWIDVPVDGLTVPQGQEVNIEGHTTGPGGVSQVEIWIDGALESTIEMSAGPGELRRFALAWMPPGPGEYTIQALAAGGDGTMSRPNSARVTVLGQEVQVSTPTPTPVEEEGEQIDEVTPIPEAVIEFWAEPTEIEAGGCTTIYWHVENVQSVVFGGHEQALEDSYADCMQKTQTYPLTVTMLDGTQEKYYVTITVIVPPAPAVDTDPPPAPQPVQPANGASLGCVSSTTLKWQAVSDPSGIAQYQVQAQRHSGDNNWQSAPGSPWTGVGGTSKGINVECGWDYRWRVRAVDGAGNTGPWSGWFTFIDPLI